jgi:hypothetical protein
MRAGTQAAELAVSGRWMRLEHRYDNITNELTPISRCSERDTMPIEISRSLGQISRAQFVGYEHSHYLPAHESGTAEKMTALLLK